MPIKITIAKIMMINPEPRLIHCIDWAFSLDRKMPVMFTRNNHHAHEPRNTPSTIKNGEEVGLPALTVAKIAMKENIVSGFAAVKNKVEVYAPIKPRLLLSAAAFSAGFDRNVLMPRIIKYVPPINLSQVC